MGRVTAGIALSPNDRFPKLPQSKLLPHG